MDNLPLHPRFSKFPRTPPYLSGPPAKSKPRATAHVLRGLGSTERPHAGKEVSLASVAHIRAVRIALEASGDFQDGAAWWSHPDAVMHGSRPGCAAFQDVEACSCEFFHALFKPRSPACDNGRATFHRIGDRRS
jgi:hypothetical protein